MSILREDHLSAINIPANLKINDQIRQYRQQCSVNGCRRPYHHFAFGQSPFPPPPKVVQALQAHADKHDYLPTAGLPELRQTIAAYYRSVFHLDCESQDIVISPGSKEMISMILATLKGSLIIPSPSWVSYLPQAKILKKEVISVKLSGENGYKLTAEQLKHAAEQTYAPQRILILNNPNNPSGAVYTQDELQALLPVCEKYNIIIISDEIYARTSFDFAGFVSMGRLYPEKTIVTGGLSKDRSAGGYRLGVGVFPKGSADLVKDILKVAGSTYSCVAAPVQYAALTAYSMDETIERYVDDCTSVHRLVGEHTSRMLNAIPGVQATIPKGAFYLYVDFNSYYDQFKKVNIKTCADFCEHLIKVEHTALLPGDSLLLPDDEFGVRASYVDYDGEAVLQALRKERPESQKEKEQFFHEHCPLIEQGVENIGRYIEQVRLGKKPVHH